MALDHLTMLAIVMLSLNQAFGEWVCQTMDNWRGQKLSLRQARMRTGIDTDTLGRMRQGDVPKIDKVIAYARGFEEDVNAALRLAGYDPVEPSPDDAAEALLEAADRGELTYEPDLDQVDVYGFEGAGSMTENDRRIINAGLRKLLEAQRRRQGRQ